MESYLVGMHRAFVTIKPSYTILHKRQNVHTEQIFTLGYVYRVLGNEGTQFTSGDQAKMRCRMCHCHPIFYFAVDVIGNTFRISYTKRYICYTYLAVGDVPQLYYYCVLRKNAKIKYFLTGTLLYRKWQTKHPR